MMHNPAHPGELLRDLSEGMRQAEIAEQVGVTRQTLSRILNGHAAVTATMALRLAAVFPNSTPENWLRLQMNYDLWQARKKLQAMAAVRKAAA